MKLQQIVRVKSGWLPAVAVLAVAGWAAPSASAASAAQAAAKRGPSDAYVVLVQADQARAVLADWQQGVFEQALEEQLALPADLCPRCAARDWRPVRAQGALLALLAWTVLMLTLVPAPPPLTGRRCGACGHAEPCRASENAA